MKVYEESQFGLTCGLLTKQGSHTFFALASKAGASCDRGFRISNFGIELLLDFSAVSLQRSNRVLQFLRLRDNDRP